MKFLDGYKTYIGAIGLFGLAVYQASQSDWSAAWASFSGAIAAIGLRHAIAKVNS